MRRKALTASWPLIQEKDIRTQEKQKTKTRPARRCDGVYEGRLAAREGRTARRRWGQRDENPEFR
jgi:hypothetical protein